MSEKVRSIVARLRRYVSERRYARRHQVRLPLTVRLHEPRLTGDARRRAPHVEGRSYDLSASGLALVLPSIRAGDRYLAGEGQTLHIVLEPPTGGPIEFLAQPMRYEHLEEGASEGSGFLLGVRIIEIAEADRTRYEQYLSQFKS